MQTTLLDHGAASGAGVEDSVKSLKVALQESAGNERAFFVGLCWIAALADICTAPVAVVLAFDFLHRSLIHSV